MWQRKQEASPKKRKKPMQSSDRVRLKALMEKRQNELAATKDKL